MTTITIERSLLEQALNALLLPCDRWNKQQFLIVKGAIEALKAALAAPATAPAHKPMPLFEINARWEQSVLGITRLQYYQVIREVESFHGITGGKP
jgi:hypothetical protein